jgi:glycosyltransferase involved in cell wall biosynthesis
VNAEVTKKYARDNIHFLIVVPTYHNQRYCIKNIEKIASQTYTNWTMCVIVDGEIAQDDGTGDLIEEYVATHNLHNKIIVKRNDARFLALKNIYDAIHTYADDRSVVVLVDGDDWLYDNHVLEKLNAIYSRYNVFLTYGQFQEYPSGNRGFCTPFPQKFVKSNMFRRYVHLPSHLRTFYAWLFKKIDRKDLLFNGNFFEMTWDQAIMYPMIEMAGERHAFIDDILYVYNCENEINDFKVNAPLQSYLAGIIRAKSRYQRLDNEVTQQFAKRPLFKQISKK